MAGLGFNLEEILNEFPFNRKSDQLDKLADFVIYNLEGNQEYVREKAEISQPTIRNMKKSFKELDHREKAILMGHITDVMYARALFEERD